MREHIRVVSMREFGGAPQRRRRVSVVLLGAVLAAATALTACSAQAVPAATGDQAAGGRTGDDRGAALAAGIPAGAGAGSPLAAGIPAGAAAGSPLAAGIPAGAAAAPAGPGAAAASGSAAAPSNTVTDVPGVQVGQVQSTTAPYLTGTTVVYFPTMAVAGVDQRGGAPATKETDLLSPLNSNPGVNAIQLGGSSMYGLAATDGVIRWLEDRGEGVGLGQTGVAPIVPAADIYDLGRGGNIKARTTAPWGYLAAEAASAGPVRQGTVGGGTGASSGGTKGGVGSASVQLANGYWVGAIVVVNSAGSTVNPADCTLLAARLGAGGEFDGLRAPTTTECHPQAAAPRPAADELNTTIAVVVTNAPLEKAAAERMATNAHDGLARAISPIHTLADGDTIFGVSTSKTNPLQVNDPADGATLNAIFNAGADTLSRAVVKAILSATSVGTRLSYCDKYPSACAQMPQLQTWRTQGAAPTIWEKDVKAAERKLAVLPVPQPTR